MEVALTPELSHSTAYTSTSPETVQGRGGAGMGRKAVLFTPGIHIPIHSQPRGLKLLGGCGGICVLGGDRQVSQLCL